MANITVKVPPPGETYNFDYTHPHMYTSNMVVIIGGLIISTGCLAMRVYTKAHLLHKFGWDDVGTQACSIYGYAHGGMGIHIWNVTPATYIVYSKVLLSAVIIYVPTLALAKISLIVLYHRTLHQKRYQRWILYSLAFMIIGYSFALMMAFLLGCRPVQRAWNPLVPGTCLDQDTLYIATAVSNIISDIALILVPIPTVLGLNMPSIQKVGLLLMFMIGCATLVTGILRLLSIMPFLNSEDPTYTIGLPDLLINIEANFAIICICLPFLRHFLRRYAPRLIGENRGLARRYTNYTVTRESVAPGRRKENLSQLQDEIKQAENGAGMYSSVGIVKKVQVEITSEDMPAEQEKEELTQQKVVICTE
ncbi:hypothetical protein BO94DRAFT_551967 [Aspergillus sclerotioniger CBS 115572]|uniref:Rhodopsin domain-containing protein n=1 Tax=Aspergillus sclerotioniger CBS 115572 TaxID=1450535 RepID=A0A317XCL1_9EURO|nr:hypothetical protein BO94DRAFT_551967 [Aspergillus sclerotioniger CBS 115572]PWY96283.1 hypothetical protein BO94DRAFT_551967 [Aspergillus sclerotioniger CBS 115572]